MFMKQNQPPFGLFLVLMVLAFFCLFLGMSGCKNPEMPPIDITSWAGDSKNGGISRKQDHVTIQCTSPEFDDYVALSYSDLKKIFSTLLTCKDWGDKKMSDKDFKRFIKKNGEILLRE